ncbi:MAG: GlxA family transcriptional regulator [Hyphomonas sp.]|nr:GlxA family transcriptional regulator [Hyphomonas sp.]MBU4061793.1 GlxA family transcriptional regulator [Alphaproteobacteria bacterium]MBU4163375.1 GlxA family transcriptional regulator [Alphaproteobacteria bacterium]
MPTRTEARRARLKVGFILIDGFTLGAFANFVDVLRLAADDGDGSRQINCTWKILSSKMTPIASSCGISVQPNEHAFEPREYDYLVVVGGVLRNSPVRLEPSLVRFLKTAAASGTPLVALCTGVFDLTEAGLMKGYRCCVSWFHHDDFRNKFLGTEPISDQLYVVDRDRLTCSGGVGSAHLAALLVDRHVGTAAAIKSLNIMMIDRVLNGEDPQPQSNVPLIASDELVQKAIHFMRQRMSLPPSSLEIAERFGISRRQLERRFQIATGSSPARVGRLIRLKHGGLLLARGDRSVEEIAEATGFCDLSHFVRSYRKEIGPLPAKTSSVSGSKSQSARTRAHLKA